MRKCFYQFFLFILYLINEVSNQDCTPNYILDNIIQDRAIFQLTSSNNSYNTTFVYRYVRSYFSSMPNVMIASGNYQSSSFDKLNYFVTPVVSRSTVNFTFISQNMNWVNFQLVFWLSARIDINIGTFYIQNIASSSFKNYDLILPQGFTPIVDDKTILLNFITGIKASSLSNSYDISVQNNGKISTNTFQIKIASNGDTVIENITIYYIVFNYQLTNFASGGGQLKYTILQNKQYKKVQSMFVPIIYMVFGFNVIKLNKNKMFTISFNLDEDYVFQTTVKQTIQYIAILYFSIGAPMQNVCSCDAYFYNNQCLNKCPSLTYPFQNYSNGGKSCLTCPPKLNETLNQFNTSCICLQGYQRIDQVCIPKSTQKKCTQQNTVLSNGACICIVGFQKVGQKCLKKCNQNQSFNQTSQNCQCNFGYLNISGSCGICGNDKIYNNVSKTCICPQNQTLNSTSNLCQCSLTNQTLVNGKCECSQGTFSINGSCTVCPTGKFYSTLSKTCQNCLTNCNKCSDNSSCSQCAVGYFYDSINKKCQINITCKINQTLINGKCQCINGTFKINEKCTVCLQGQFYDSISQSCFPCALNCISCKNPASCDKCKSPLVYNKITGLCSELLSSLSQSDCGLNQVFVQGVCQCAQGFERQNTSCVACKAGQFYSSKLKTCGNCSENCIKCSNQATCLQCSPYFKIINNQCKLNFFDIKSGYPKFTLQKIVTDFVVFEKDKMKTLNTSYLQKITKIEFQNKSAETKNIIIHQNPKNASQIRIIFFYMSQIPLKPYLVRFTFFDSNISSKNDTKIINYNVFEKGIVTNNFI